jgi:hypothetical protein
LKSGSPIKLENVSQDEVRFLSSYDSRQVTDDSEEEMNSKRRKRWEIVPNEWHVLDEPRPTRAIIRSPEMLAWDSVNVEFGSKPLIRDVDFVCGLSEVIILRLPNPDIVVDKSSDGSVPSISAIVSVWDDQGVEGKVNFNFVFSRP